MVKFYSEFIFGTIERIKLQISTFCHFCHQKRELDTDIHLGIDENQPLNEHTSFFFYVWLSFQGYKTPFLSTSCASFANFHFNSSSSQRETIQFRIHRFFLFFQKFQLSLKYLSTITQGSPTITQILNYRSENEKEKKPENSPTTTTDPVTKT